MSWVQSLSTVMSRERNIGAQDDSKYRSRKHLELRQVGRSPCTFSDIDDVDAVFNILNSCGLHAGLGATPGDFLSVSQLSAQAVVQFT